MVARNYVLATLFEKIEDKGNDFWLKKLIVQIKIKTQNPASWDVEED